MDTRERERVFEPSAARMALVCVSAHRMRARAVALGWA
jgi:hypothetical protein